MAELFKNRYNHESLGKLAMEIQTVYESFPIQEFLNSTMDESWSGLEFKQRVHRISINLGRYLPSDYETAISIIDKVILNYDICLDGFVIFFPHFVEIFGQAPENWDISMTALARYTQYASAEFAVRSFIINDENRMMAQMFQWSKHDNEHVRRLASEGCRPRLPWGQALPSFQKNPTPILRILEQLKADSSPYVRKSVANNLNDISKTHPDLVVNIANNWYGNNKHTDWIVKHGCRTLLKSGNSEVLQLFGFIDNDNLKVDKFTLANNSIHIGDSVTFEFEIESNKQIQVRLEYGIDYVKANGKRNRKIFQISELAMKPNKKLFYIKSHSFADNSTRKHYAGIHALTLIINGIERGTQELEVLNAK